MTDDIRIRPATPADSDAIARVHVESWQATYAGILPDSYLIGLSAEQQAKSWRAMLTHPESGAATLVVEAQFEDIMPEIVGFGSAGRARDIHLLYDGEIYSLYVAPDWQGQGLGQRLLSLLFRRLYEADMDDALLWVLAENPTRFFYEHMGGQRIATRQETLAGESLEAVAYGWSDLEAWLQQVGA